ncbi:hypothetical protein OOT33_10740 [Sphingobium sp. DEHP117]|uniref:hypothetical protein n=1 Tax=Sphingobium sp. DEHP117 TaxID=2993436 RepID=UPI0027D48508|nr:hypothetical protein [Sphingobium sp. DEHP117]MDQ4420906.1 hypothetical protein [Sphingobium sp. DEHP117]
MSALEGATACCAALMLAASPITGACNARVMALCTGDGQTRTMLVWDDGPAPSGPQQQPSQGKACHACLPDKRKPQSGQLDTDTDI